MRLGRALTLRLCATAATVATLLGSTVYVAAHPKDPAAPLQPPVAKSGPGPTRAPQASGRIRIEPGVRQTALPGITFTHVS